MRSSPIRVAESVGIDGGPRRGRPTPEGANGAGARCARSIRPARNVSTTVELFHRGQRGRDPCPQLSRGRHPTDPAHMPKARPADRRLAAGLGDSSSLDLIAGGLCNLLWARPLARARGAPCHQSARSEGSATEARGRRAARAVPPAADVLRIGVGRTARSRPRGVVRDAEAAVVSPRLRSNRLPVVPSICRPVPVFWPAMFELHGVPDPVDLQPRLPVARGRVALTTVALALDLQAVPPVARGAVARQPIAGAASRTLRRPRCRSPAAAPPGWRPHHLAPAWPLPSMALCSSVWPSSQQPHPRPAVALHSQPRQPARVCRRRPLRCPPLRRIAAFSTVWPSPVRHHPVLGAVQHLDIREAHRRSCLLRARPLAKPVIVPLRPSRLSPRPRCARPSPRPGRAGSPHPDRA